MQNFVRDMEWIKR